MPLSNIILWLSSCRAAVEKLHCVDDAFRQQLESAQASHQAELLRLANEKEKQVEYANQKVNINIGAFACVSLHFNQWKH